MAKSKRACKKPDYYKVEVKEQKKRNLKLENAPKLAISKRIIPRENLLVWGRCKGFGWWPGRIANRAELSGPIDPPDDPTRWIKWFGDDKYTETKVDQMAYFHDFSLFKENIYQRSALYNKAVDSALIEAAKRSGKALKNELEALAWAKNNFFPEGYTKFAPVLDKEYNPSSIGDANQPKNFVSSKTACCEQSKQTSFLQQQAFKKLHEGVVDIETICLGCGSLEVTSAHPLFFGGLCNLCQTDYKESVYLLDEQGYSMYCCVCAGGEEVASCDNTNCGRCFCKTCLNVLVHEGAFAEVSASCPWLCYICVEDSCHGNLKRRHSWADELRLFINKDDESDDDSMVDFEIFPVPLSIPLSDRRGIRVLSLFDGIGTACHVLKQLNINIDVYCASEIDHEAICITETRHPGVVTCIGDVSKINDHLLNKLGPFDLVIGGSPCNDLSIVNPSRKGIWSDKGSGCLFFEFVRILRSCQVLSASRGRFLFWMFENVMCMDKETKTVITRFLQRKPVCLDASIVSPAHRARYYWGNLPGMRRPMVASTYHKLAVQDCLEPGRSTDVVKLRTITTNAGSVRDSRSEGATGGMGKAIVMQQRNQKDCLWITELERIFGFPEHYTDVSNMTRSGRLRLLGKSWSVPVIRHLFSPLKDYFILV